MTVFYLVKFCGFGETNSLLRAFLGESLNQTTCINLWFALALYYLYNATLFLSNSFSLEQESEDWQSFLFYMLAAASLMI